VARLLLVDIWSVPEPDDDEVMQAEAVGLCLSIANNKKRNEKGLIFSMTYIMIFSLENIMKIS